MRPIRNIVSDTGLGQSVAVCLAVALLTVVMKYLVPREMGELIRYDTQEQVGVEKKIERMEVDKGRRKDDRAEQVPRR